MLLVDFDNTLLHNPFDVDLTGDLDKFFETWETLPDTPFNMHVINWLKDKEFKIFTNRGAETHEKVKKFLDSVGLDARGFIYCCGDKEAMREEHNGFLIDNAKKYRPEVLVTRNTRKADLNLQYMKFLRSS